MRTILVVDVQNGFIKPSVKRLPQDIRNHIQANEYEHVLFSKFVNRKNSNFVKLLQWDKVFTTPDTDIASELVHLSVRENTFTKSTYSAFKSERLNRYLKRHSIKKIEVCGLEADGCVLATAFEGFDLGYEIIVLNSLVQSSTTLGEAATAIAKRNIDRKGKKR